jgi:hypothetical protein
MGVSVRLSRNVRVYVPFWVAIPAYLLAAAVWIVILVVWALVLLAGAIGSGTAHLYRSGAKAIGDRQPRQPTHAAPGGQQARQEAFTAGREESARQREERRQERVVQVGVRQEAATQLAAERKAHRADRRARRGTRPPLSWPGYGNIAAAVMGVAGVVLAGVAGSNAHSPLVPVVGSLLIAAIVTAAVCVPVAIWRKIQARRRAR